MKAPEGVLYVGKAKNLKNRLLSYFVPPQHEHPRTEMMLARVQEFDVILTETEAEALILEATLIKKYRPKFNIRLKDDKAYPYLKIQGHLPFPRLEWARRVQKDGARYFGPFPSAWAARQVMALLNEVFRLRDCSDNTFNHRSRPCILHEMGKCAAPCVGLIGAAAYQALIQEVIQVLEGKTTAMVQSLRKEMDAAAVREDYEVAAHYRDQMKNLEMITQTQGVLEAGSQKNRDVIGLARREQSAYGTLLHIVHGKLVSVRHYRLENADTSLGNTELLFNFLTQHYLGAQEKIGPVEVLVAESPMDQELLEKTLEVVIRLPSSSVDEQLLNVARINAELALEQRETQAKGHGVKALEELSQKLHLARLPSRIECYDISNIQGQDPVASRVVFIDGAPNKDLYRKYKIRTVEGSNDFAMMKEVLRRRFSNPDEALPDLVVVDGGKGQLSQAVEILEELSVQGVELVGLAKARVESDFKGKEIKSSMERCFIPNRKNPVPLLPHTEAYKLLTHVRDEAHRFAVTYHRLLRSKRSLNSSSSKSGQR